MYKDIVTVSVVTFHAEWGDKERNLNRILGYMEAAAKKGSDILVMPEMALTSYDDEEDVPVEKKMQHLLAETVPGPTSDIVSAKAKELGIYVVFGMPIRDSEKADTVYNGVSIAGPEGFIGSYSKIHLSNPEPNWATPGDTPFIMDTPWGPVGVAICYDTYCFPELMDYYVAKGCRLYLNPTAVSHRSGEHLMDDTLRAQVIREGIFIASADLAGLDRTSQFWGGSSIIGPSKKTWAWHYYAGCPSADPGADEQAMYTATIDLSLTTRFLYRCNPSVGRPDWRPDLYAKWFSELAQDPEFGKKE